KKPVDDAPDTTNFRPDIRRDLPLVYKRYRLYLRYYLVARTFFILRFPSSNSRLPRFDSPLKCIVAHMARILSYSRASNTSSVSSMDKFDVYTVGLADATL